MKTIAIIFGIIFIILGALGFVPTLTPGGKLFGIFHVNDLHNIVHLITGVVALWVGFTSPEASKIFFKVFGVIYAIVTALGFYYGDAPILGVLANNLPITWLHLAIAAISLWLGFGCCCNCSSRPPQQ